MEPSGFNPNTNQPINRPANAQSNSANRGESQQNAIRQNTGVYKKDSDSVQAARNNHSPQANTQATNDKNPISKNADIFSKNPILGQKLQNAAEGKLSSMNTNKRDKKLPPQVKQNGISSLIRKRRNKNNPNHIKPSFNNLIPKQLQGLSSRDNNIFAELSSSLETMSEQEFVKVNVLNDADLLQEFEDAKVFLPSIKEQLNIDTDEIFKLPVDEIKQQIKNLIESAEDPVHIEVLSLIEQQIPEQKTLQSFLLLALPYPFAFDFEDREEEIEEELHNLKEEDQEEREQDGSPEDNEEKEETGIIIETPNFGKVLICLRQSPSTGALEISIKGQDMAEELAVALTSNLEFNLPRDISLTEREFKRWKKSIPSKISKNSISLLTKGEPSREIVHVVKNILEIIEQSDDDIANFYAGSGSLI